MTVFCPFQGTAATAGTLSLQFRCNRRRLDHRRHPRPPTPLSPRLRCPHRPLRPMPTTRYQFRTTSTHGCSIQLYHIIHIVRPGRRPSPTAAAPPPPPKRQPARVILVAGGRRGRADLRELSQALRLRLHHFRAQNDRRKRLFRQRQRLRQRERGWSGQHLAEDPAQAGTDPDDRTPRVTRHQRGADSQETTVISIISGHLEDVAACAPGLQIFL